MKFKVFLVVSSALVWSAGVSAETLGVLISHSGDDVVGKRFAAEVKNSIRSNSLFHLIYDADEMVYGISVVTIDPDESNRDADLRTTYSATMLLSSGELLDYHLTSQVGVCGSDKVRSCADKLVQELSVQHEDLIEVMMQAGALE